MRSEKKNVWIGKFRPVKLLAFVLSAVMTVSLAGAVCFCAEGTADAAQVQAESAAPAYADASVVQTNGIDGWPKAMDIGSDYGCVMDTVTGAVLFNKGEHTATPPASLTKIMTALLAIENGDPDAQVTMTATGVAYATDGSSNLYTQVGEVFTLRDMLYGVLLKSANDMATQVGEFIGGGSLDQFIAMMNERAAQLGCKNTHFVNACGMPAEGHLTSAYDLCLICREASKNEELMKILGTSTYTIPATNMTAERSFANHHPFASDPANAYEGFLGGKTGYTDAALSTLATFAKRDTTTLVCVTLHGNGTETTSADARALLDYSFGNFKHIRMDKRELVAEGGIVSVPKDASAKDLTSETREAESPEFGKVAVTAYKYKKHLVGRTVMTQATIDELKRQEEERLRAESAAAAASAAAAMSAEEMAESEAEPVHETISYSGTGQSAVIHTGQETVTLPLGITMNRTAFIAIAALALLILLGILMIIITLIARRGEE